MKISVMNGLGVALGCAAVLVLQGSDVNAERRTRASVAKRNITAVCPASITRPIGSQFFYKNNKPIRAGSAITAPVIGQNPVMTLAGQPGGPRIFGGSGALFASNGTRITTLIPYPCRSDHCSGRVVSSMLTGIGRRAAIRASGKPSGFIKVGGICVAIKDIGRCEGGGINYGRPLCDRTVT